MTDPSTFDLALTAVWTVAVFSYILGDNPLYRITLNLFAGSLVGYSFGIVVRDVLWEALLESLHQPLAMVLPLLLGITLLIKGLPKYAHIGNSSVAYLVGVGAAVALGGAILGTLGPQLAATGNALSAGTDAVRGLLVAIGTACALMAFNFTFTAGRKQGLAGLWAALVRPAAWLGRAFLILAFAVAYAGALTATLSVLAGRIQYFVDALFR